ncbi:hypothetical protein AAEX28_02140 [Lentisphaerota bacterium WC36G]|nr:hypothetical protein LJT99_05025 [Lentisphaerae bacterium WC36]
MKNTNDVNLEESDYIFYIDESFYEWFGLKHNDSDFCHAGITIPREKLSDLKCFTANLRKIIRKNYQKKYGNKAIKEIKSSHLYALDTVTIKDIAKKINNFCTKNNCYMFGFYTRADSYINNLIRDKYFDKYGGSIYDHSSNVEDELQEIKNDVISSWKKGKHDVNLLDMSYRNIVSSATHFHGRYLKKSFMIQYDPRHRKEDKILNEKMLEYANVVSKVTNIENPLLGYKNDLSSDNCDGLFLADLICADIRRLFKNNRELLELGSRLEVLSAKVPSSWDILQPPPYYSTPFPSEFINEMIINNKNLLFSENYQNFASKIISCYAINGEARNIDFHKKQFLDMAD